MTRTTSSIQHCLFRNILVFTMSLCGVAQAQAQEIDDVETDMESALAESEAAQTEASAAKERLKEERAQFEKAKGEAEDATLRAKEKQASATKEIQVLEGKTAATIQERKKHEKTKAAAEKQIKVLEARVAAKKNKLMEAEAKRDAARAEKEAQEAIVAKLTQDEKDVEATTTKTRDETSSLTADISRLKDDVVMREKALVQMRANAKRAAEVRDRKLKEKEALRRKVSSVPNRVIMRAVKRDCDVTDAASDGALVLGQVKPGPHQEVYRVIDKRWVEIKFGTRHGFVAKSCF